MKKVSSTLRDNLSFVPRPFALADHKHNEYLPVDGDKAVEITTDVVFTGSVSGLDATDIFVEAAHPISALRIISSVGTLGEYADPTDPESVRKILGMSVTAGTTGAQIKMLSYGKHVDGGWSFDPNKPLYLGVDGTITQVAPVTGNVILLGHAQSASTIFLDIKQPIILA